MNIKQKIIKDELIQAKNKLNELEKYISNLETQLISLSNEHLIGKRVEVYDLCKRGCCIESKHFGKIISVDGDLFKILNENNKEEKVYKSDLRVI